MEQVICHWCGTEGPEEHKPGEAEQLAREQRFKQDPRGRWKCPECPAEEIVWN